MAGHDVQYGKHRTRRSFSRIKEVLGCQAPTIEWRRSKTIRSLIQIFFVEGHTVLPGGRFRNELVKMKTSFSENKPHRDYRQKNRSKPLKNQRKLGII